MLLVVQVSVNYECDRRGEPYLQSAYRSDLGRIAEDSDNSEMNARVTRNIIDTLPANGDHRLHMIMPKVH